MGVTIPTYCTREDVKRSLDFAETARNNWQIDRAIQAAVRNIDGHLHRTFVPTDGTKFFDWPNFQYAYPWRLWFDQWDLAAPTSVVSGGVAIPLSACHFEPVNSGPPYTYMELRRDLSYSFGNGPTPQREIAISGTWCGAPLDTDPAGALAAAISSTTATSATVTDGSLVGVGNLLIVDSERMLVTDRANVATSQTLTLGVTSASAADNTMTVPDGAQLHLDEVIQIDSERMLIVDVTGNNVMVKRAWDGTVLATHSTGTTIYASRQLTIARAQGGTTAATHSNGATISVHRIPSLIRTLALGEAANRVLEETGGYAPTQGEGGPNLHGLGTDLADLWDEATTTYGRKSRQRVI